MGVKQKLIRIVAGVAAVAIMGGASAYFTAEGRAEEAPEAGEVKIELVEETVDSEGERRLFENVEGVMPGDSYSKIPTVKNSGDGEAWVRVEVSITAQLQDGTVINVPADAIDIDYNMDDWLNIGDDYYYYKGKLSAGEITDELFSQVVFSRELGNLYQGATFDITLRAQAVQAANNGETVLDAEGWPGTEVVTTPVSYPDTGENTQEEKGAANSVVLVGVLLMAVMGTLTLRQKRKQT